MERNHELKEGGAAIPANASGWRDEEDRMTSEALAEAAEKARKVNGGGGRRFFTMCAPAACGMRDERRYPERILRRVAEALAAAGWYPCLDRAVTGTVMLLTVHDRPQERTGRREILY